MSRCPLDRQDPNGRRTSTAVGDRRRGSEGGRIQRQWQIEGFPCTFVLDGKGVIRFKGLRGEKLAEAVEMLLREGDATKKRG